MSTTPVENDPTGVSVSMFSGSTSRAFTVLREREFGVGLVAGVGAMFVLGLNGQDALQFAGIAALGNSVGDAAAKSVELRTQLGAYNYNTWYVDVTDVATGTIASAAMFWYLGASGNNLLYSAAIAGVACGIGPKVSTFIGDKLGA